MVNVKNFVLKYIKENIPKEILEYGLMDEDDDREDSLDSLLDNKVVTPILLRDLNLSGGVQISVAIRDCEYRNLNNNEYEIYVPKELTNNRSIIAPLNITISVPTQVTLGRNVSSQNAFLHFSNRVRKSVSPSFFNTTSDLTLIGDNLILARFEHYFKDIRFGRLTLEVEHMDNFETINTQYSRQIANLGVLVTKWYIYNKKLIELNKGEIVAGHELGIIKDTIDNYSSCKEEYDELLRKWKVSNMMNNTEFRKMLIRLSVGGNA